MKFFFFFLSIIFFTTSYSQSPASKDSVQKISTNSQNGEDDPKIFTKAEKNPEFPGGQNAWGKFLSIQIDSSLTLISGTVPPGTYKAIVRFVVGKNGVLRDIVAETGYGYGIESEAIRIIKSSPAWIPAEQNGHTVNFYLRQPIIFVISSK